MPKELVEIKTFNKGIISSPSESDIPPDAAAHSIDVDPSAVDGKLTGRPEDVVVDTGNYTGHYSCEIKHETDETKKNVVIYDKGGSKLRHVVDLDGTPAESEVLSGHSMTGNSATFANTSDSNIRLGAGKGTESKWIGYVNHEQFGTASSGLQILPSRLSNVDTFTRYDKIQSLGSYVYGLKKGATSIIKHSISNGEVVGQSSFPFVALQCISLELQTSKIWLYDLDTTTHAHGVIYRLDSSSLEVDKTILPSPFSGDEGTTFQAYLAPIPKMVRNSDLSSSNGSFLSSSSAQRPGWYKKAALNDWDDFEIEKAGAIDTSSYVSDMHVYQEAAGVESIVTLAIYGEGEDYTKVKVEGGTAANFKRGYSKGLLFRGRVTNATSGALDFYDCTPQSYQKQSHFASSTNTKDIGTNTGTFRLRKYFLTGSGGNDYAIYQGWFMPTNAKGQEFTFPIAGTNYKGIVQHTDVNLTGGGNGARTMKVMYYPSEYPLSNAYSGWLDVSAYSGADGHNHKYKSLSWYATTVERTGELKYPTDDGAVDGSSTGTDFESPLVISGRNWGGQAYMSWTLDNPGGGNTNLRLTKVRNTLFDIPYLHTLNTKSGNYNQAGSPGSPSNESVSAIGSTEGEKGCLFNSGIGVHDLRVESSWDGTTGDTNHLHGKIHSLHVASGPHPTSAPWTNTYAKYADVWLRFGFSASNKLRVLKYRIKSECIYVGDNGNYKSSNASQAYYSTSGYDFLVPNETIGHINKWASPIGNLAAIQNDTATEYIASSGTWSPALPHVSYGWLLSGYPSSSGWSLHPNTGSAFMQSGANVITTHTDNTINKYRAFSVLDSQKKSLTDMTTIHATDAISGNTEAAAIKKIDNATLTGAAALLKESKVSLTATSLSSGSGFDTNYEYFYKVSFVYDEYQESQMVNATESITSTSGYGFQIVIRILDHATTLSKRVSHVNLYRGEAPNQTLNKSDVLYRLVEKIELNSTWTTSGNDKLYTVVDAKAENVGITFESNAGVSEVLPHTTLDYGLSTLLNNTLFVTKAAGVGLTGVENYLFKSLAYKYDMFDWSQDFINMPEKSVAIASYGGRVFCFGSNNTYRVEPNNMYVEDTYEGIGCISDQAHVATEYGLFFCDNNNIYQYTNAVKPIGNAILKNSYDENFGYFELLKICKAPILSFDSKNNSLLVSLTKTDNSIAYIYVYTLSTNRWDFWTTTPISAIIPGGKGDVYTVRDDTASSLYKLAGSSVARKAYTWISKNITGFHQSQKKKFYRLDVPYTGVAPTITYGFDGANPTETGTSDNDTGVASKKFKDTKRGIQVKVVGAATTGGAAPNFIESIGVVLRRFAKLIGLS